MALHNISPRHLPIPTLPDSDPAPSSNNDLPASEHTISSSYPSSPPQTQHPSPADSASASPPPSSSGKKKHVCGTCQKAFTTSGHLSRHARVHTGERNHKCPFPGCETRCSRQDNLQQHYRIHLSPGSRRSSGSATRTALARAMGTDGQPRQSTPKRRSKYHLTVAQTPALLELSPPATPPALEPAYGAVPPPDEPPALTPAYRTIPLLNEYPDVKRATPFDVGAPSGSAPHHTRSTSQHEAAYPYHSSTHAGPSNTHAHVSAPPHPVHSYVDLNYPAPADGLFSQYDFHVHAPAAHGHLHAPSHANSPSPVSSAASSQSGHPTPPPQPPLWSVPHSPPIPASGLGYAQSSPNLGGASYFHPQPAQPSYPVHNQYTSTFTNGTPPMGYVEEGMWWGADSTPIRRSYAVGVGGGIGRRGEGYVQ